MDKLMPLKQSIHHFLSAKIYALNAEKEALSDVLHHITSLRLEKIKRQHERILYPYYLKSLGVEAYTQAFYEHAIKRLYHQAHLKVLRKKHTTQDLEAFNGYVHAINTTLKENMLHYTQKTEKILKDTDYKSLYLQKKEMLDSVYEAYKTRYLDKDRTLYTRQTRRIDKSIARVQNIQKKLNIQKQTLLEEDTLLKLSDVTMQFGGLKALDALSFSVKKGEIFGLIGPNGAGKTTVFNCITQFYSPTSGTIYFNNKYSDDIVLNQVPVHGIIKEGIARTFQNVELIYELSVLDNLLVGAHSQFKASLFDDMFHTKKMKREFEMFKQKALNILTDLNLLPYKDVIPYGLPYGILKRIELARVLMTNPTLIILDEPAAGLNEIETKTLAKTIKTIQKTYQTTIFLVEHDMNLVMDICDTVCAISFGKLLAIGTPKAIKSNLDVQKAYLGGA